jgi:hypothetical protein
MDLHLHTPASSDYQEPNVGYLDILRQAEARSLDIIAFTDHNTVAGYGAMQRELESLALLESLGRMNADEDRRLKEYRRLFDKVLVLPGFEFTATFGFHILGIFPPETPVNYLEHLLLSLNVPLDKLQHGSSTVGATSDVLTAYRIINQAGGLVIAAHANSSNGVVMRGLDFGGQTKIAYTQDPFLHCLEVTDLDKKGRYATRRFFDGSKPEYPRAMRCIQGSDAHRLVRATASSKELGVGDRVTEILLESTAFDALAVAIKSNDFSLTRPFRGPALPQDFIQLAREEGQSIVQSFHLTVAERGGHLNRVLQDVCAMANANGGTIYIGLSANPKEKIAGVREPQRTINRIKTVIDKRVSPTPDITVDSLMSQGKHVVRIIVFPGQNVPYAIDDNRFYVRDEDETTLAVRDEIVRLVERSLEIETVMSAAANAISSIDTSEHPDPLQEDTKPGLDERSSPGPPRTGVEIVSSEDRDGTIYHTVRDLRNGNLISNVTRSSARKLWHYAITQVESDDPSNKKIEWHGNIALVGQRKRDSRVWYDLAMRDEKGVHFYYGVTDSGLNDVWMSLVETLAN